MDKPLTISAKMISEGIRVYEELKGTCDAHSLVVEVYRAMASVGRSDRPRAKAGMRQRAVRGARSSDE
jgi:hypothetical protein